MTLLSIILMSAALAEDPAPAATESVTLPTGKVVEAKIITPEADTLEAATLEAMKLAQAGDFDKWIAKFCGPTLCEGPTAIASVKRLNLSSAQRTVGKCHSDETLSVTKVKGDRETEDLVTIYTWCGDGRMPAPVTWEKIDDDWKIRSFSW